MTDEGFGTAPEVPVAADGGLSDSDERSGLGVWASCPDVGLTHEWVASSAPFGETGVWEVCLRCADCRASAEQPPKGET